MRSVQVVLVSGYHGLYEQDKALGLASISKILGDFFVPGAILIAAASRNKPYWTFTSAVLIATYSLTYFFLGYRGWAVMPLLAYIWVIHLLVKPLPIRLLTIVGATLMFVVFPFIALNRNDTSNSVSITSVYSSFLGEKSPITLSLKEMGYSMNTVAHTIQLVPSQRDFDNGKSYAYAALTVVPNFFWSIHPTIARGTPADWLVKTVDPIVAYNGGGLGYSFIAEAYLNFGFVGALLCLMLQGYLIGNVVLYAATSRNAAIIGCSACFFSFIFYYVRQDSTLIFRPLIWYALLPYITILLVNSLNSYRLNKND